MVCVCVGVCVRVTSRQAGVCAFILSYTVPSHLCILLYRLETEVSMWNDSRSDIIIVAKEMCMLMMDMSDFTR